MRPQTSALLDQAQAATGETTRIMATLAELENTPVRYVVPGPVHRAILARFSTTALAARMTLCPHLTYDAPRPSFWCAWAPGRIRCDRCAEAASRRIHGTREDRRCDHCGKIRPSIHRGAMELPPVVVDLPPYPPRCVPPVIVLFGLCPDCQATDHKEDM